MTAAPLLDYAPEPIQVRLLGPLELACGNTPSARMQRRLLALLAVNASAFVSVHDIAQELWDADMARGWMNSVTTYVMMLRRVVGKEGIVTGVNGYTLALRPDAVDGLRYLRLVDQAHREHHEGRLRQAQDTLRAAGSLWRGRPLLDVDCGALLTAWARHVGDRRRSAWLLRINIELGLGLHRDVADELRSAWRSDLVNEPTAMYLMTALYRCDLQAEALWVYGKTRHALREELGIEPGPGLRRLQQQILAGDPALELEEKC